MTKPLLILGNGAPGHLDDAPAGSVYIDSTNLPSGGGSGGDSKSYLWGSVSYDGPATNGAAPTGGVSLSAQMQVNGAPEYVIQGAFDNTISTTENAKWQGTFFGNVPAYQASNPNANPAYAIAVQESASLGEKFPEIRLKGLNPSMMSPNGIGDTAKGLDQSDDLGRLVRSRGFDNFSNVGTQSYEIGEMTYKPQPDSGRDFISGSSGTPAVSFRQISWQGAYQIGGKWVDVLPARYAVMGYWGDPNGRKVWAAAMAGGGTGLGSFHYLNLRASNKAGDLDNGSDTAFYKVPTLDGNNSSNMPFGANYLYSGDNQSESDLKSPLFRNAVQLDRGDGSKVDYIAAYSIEPPSSPANVSKELEHQFLIRSSTGGTPFTPHTLVFTSSGKLLVDTKQLNVSAVDEARFQKIAATGKFPDFVNDYLNKHLVSTQRVDITETTSQLERLQKQYDDLEKRLAILEGVPK